MARVLGIDIGGTGIKAAPVDVTTGTLLARRAKLDTPHPAEPTAVSAVMRGLKESFSWTGPVGITFPGVVTCGIIRDVANLGNWWIGTDAREFFGRATGLAVSVINDADEAGIAEMRFGAGAGQKGTVLMLTLGTGIGSGAVHRRDPGAEHRVRPHRDPRRGSGATSVGARPRGTGPQLGQVGRPGR